MRIELSGADLVVQFPNRRGSAATALDQVEFTFGQGEVVALVGESGSGKTTLGRTLIGLQRPTSGRVSLSGQPISYDRSLRELRRTVQMVLQDPAGSLNPRHTAYESVAEGIRIHKLASAAQPEAELVAQAMSDAGLRPPESLFHRFPHELSGGQRQRLLIAGALAIRPQLLIADEPVSSLDASIRGEILRLLLTLKRKFGLGILVITHDLGLAWNIADRVAVMYLGRIVEAGPTESVLSNPKHPYTQALLSVIPDATGGTPVLLQGEIPDSANIPPGCRFHPRCPRVAAEPELALPEGGTLRDSCVSRSPAVVVADPTRHQAACWLPGVSS